MTAEHHRDANETVDQICAWLLPRWPGILINGGLALFALACVESQHLPVEAVLIGPALMLAGALVSGLGK